MKSATGEYINDITDDSDLIQMLYDLNKDYHERVKRFRFGWSYHSADSYIAIYKTFLEYMGDVRGKRILEAASGPGHFLYVLTKLGADVTGMDIEVRAVNMARQYNPDMDMRYKSVEVVGELFEPENFDAVISKGLFEWPVIEESIGIDDILSQFYKITKTGGINVHQTFKKESLIFEKDFEDAGFEILPPIRSILGDAIYLITAGKNN